MQKLCVFGQRLAGRRIFGANRPDLDVLASPGHFPDQPARREHNIIEKERKGKSNFSLSL
jgi:hypothetical protein